MLAPTPPLSGLRIGLPSDLDVVPMSMLKCAGARRLRAGRSLFMGVEASALKSGLAVVIQCGCAPS